VPQRVGRNRSSTEMGAPRQFCNQRLDRADGKGGARFGQKHRILCAGCLARVQIGVERPAGSRI